MKKMFALVLALVLSMTVVAAVAETTESAIPVEFVTLSDGLEFAVPTGWTYEEITEEMAAEGYILKGQDDATGRALVVTMGQMEGTLSAAELAESMAADTENYANAAAVTNEYGMEVVLFESADNIAGGFTFVDADGWIYAFTYGHIDGSVITDDTDLAALVSETINTIGYVEVAEEAAE